MACCGGAAQVAGASSKLMQGNAIFLYDLDAVPSTASSDNFMEMKLNIYIYASRISCPLICHVKVCDH
jgi:hypothetical protein